MSLDLLKEHLEDTETCIREKWLPIALGNKEGKGEQDCALCAMYREKNTLKCNLCPIYIDKGVSCHESANGLESSVWHIDAEDWFVPYTYAYERGASSYLKQAKQKAYAMLFYLHDLADRLRDKITAEETKDNGTD